MGSAIRTLYTFRNEIKNIIITKIGSRENMYKTANKRIIFRLIELEANLIDIEKVENKEDERKFVFCFSTGTKEDNEKINRAKEDNEKYTNEEFCKLHDIYWKLIRQKYPKK
jgi:hypothetical protein